MYVCAYVHMYTYINCIAIYYDAYTYVSGRATLVLFHCIFGFE